MRPRAALGQPADHPRALGGLADALLRGGPGQRLPAGTKLAGPPHHDPEAEPHCPAAPPGAGHGGGCAAPNHPVTLALIEAAGVPIAAPSANISGRPSCTTAPACAGGRGGQDRLHLDGGPCAVGGGVHHCGPDRGPRPGCCGPADCLWRPWRKCWARWSWMRRSPARWGRGGPGPRHEIPPLCPRRPGDGGHRHPSKIRPVYPFPAERRLWRHLLRRVFAPVPHVTARPFGSMQNRREQAQRVFDALRSL